MKQITQIVSRITIGVLAASLLVCACSKDSIGPVRRPWGASSHLTRSTGGTTDVPVTFTRSRSAGVVVSMPDDFSFNDFHFVTKNLTDDTWAPEYGSIAAWSTPGDNTSAFEPTDATQSFWPLDGNGVPKRFSFYGASYNWNQVLDWHGRAEQTYDWSFIYTGKNIINEYDDLFAEEIDYDTWVSRNFTYGSAWEIYSEGNDVKLHIKNPMHSTDFVAAASFNNGVKLSVPMEFQHVLTRVESATFDLSSFHSWVQNRGLDDDYVNVWLWSIELNDGEEAIYTFDPSGITLFSDWEKDWSSTDYFMMPTVKDFGEPYMYLNGLGAWGVVFDELMDEPDYVTLFDLDLPSDGGKVIYFGSPFLGNLNAPLESDNSVSRAIWESNKHYFGHPMLLPGKHKVRITFLVEDHDGKLHKDTNGLAKLYTAEATFNLPAGKTVALDIALNSLNKDCDLTVSANVAGWAENFGGTVSM